MAFSRAPGTTPYGKQYEVVSVPWTSDGSGNYTETVPLNGWLVKSWTDPSDGPTDNYDITLIKNTADMIAGALGDRDTTNGETVVHATPIFMFGDHTFTVAVAGASKSGTAYFLLVNEL
jgi:hypothetical protein